MTAENLIQINQDKCTQCGLCVKVCRGTLDMGEHGPEVIDDFCIACGHCVAACPNGALDHRQAPLEKQVLLKEMPIQDANTAARFLRSRRSVRSFQKKRVPRETIHELLDIAHFAPTACNSQGVSYLVVDDAVTLKEIAAAVADWAEEDLRYGALGKSPWSKNTANTIRCYHENGRDTILRDAPCLIIAMAQKERFALGRDNTHFALTYAQLYAPALALGTCWSGLFEYCAAAGYEPLLQLLQLPQSKSVTGALLVGYPSYTFKRLVDREPLQVSWQ
ncbi:nitroreductase family protein [Clostridium drakei]|uniref:Ferredoxin n=1 Tax=Clostridium drakei TaxID=332101 RepID=A0A2U8DYR5_9CLOT|nr:nitroreductase family protein [Clostridium drakei]AWI07202.1 ferredoxin [Clostridium drakei]